MSYSRDKKFITPREFVEMPTKQLITRIGQSTKNIGIFTNEDTLPTIYNVQITIEH